MDDPVETVARALTNTFNRGRGLTGFSVMEEWLDEAGAILAQITPMLVQEPAKTVKLLSADDMDRLIYRLTGDTGNWDEIRAAVDGLAVSGICRARPAPPAIGEGRG